MAFSLAQGEKETENGSVFTSVYFLAGLAFHFVLAFGVALACFLLQPAWMFMYFTDPRIVPTAIVVYIFAGYFAMYVLGFLSVRAMREVDRRLPWGAFFSVLALIFCFIGLTFHRLWYVGDFPAYVTGVAKALPGTSLFWILLVAMPLAVVGLVAVVLALRRRFRTAQAGEMKPATGGAP